MDVLKVKRFLLKLALVVISLGLMMACVKLLFLPNSFVKPIDRIAKTDAVVVKPDLTVLVQEVRGLAKLETAVISYQQVIPAERDQERLWGVFGEKMLFVAYGQTIAGVDLSSFGEDDMLNVGPNTVFVNLPDATIFHVVIDNKKSYVASREKGLLASNDEKMETKLRQQAEIECEKTALSLDILNKANNNARDFIRKFLKMRGIEHVVFVNPLTYSAK